MTFAPFPLDDAFADLLIGSYRRVVGGRLLPGAVEAGDSTRWLYEEAPFPVLAHDTSTDPVFVYANRAAQRCFEYGWAEFVGMPSRLAAQEPERADRDKFMAAVRRHGFADQYRGLRIAKSGRRFWIENTTVWNVIDRNGSAHGQAALIPLWTDA